MSRLMVVGSYNASMFFKGDRIPREGETVIGQDYLLSAGGKGSNQAIAARYQGAPVGFIGKLGNDAYAEDAMRLYRRVGLSSDTIYRDDSIHTGVAAIFLNGAGRNCIMVCPGANLRLSVREILEGVARAGDVQLVGFQLENDVQVVTEAICALHEMGIATLLDPAPAVPLSEKLYGCLDYIKPNEHEAALLTGIAIADERDAFRAADALIARGVKNVIITLGEGGVVAVNREIRLFIPGISVEAVDTTGAGDIFSGTLMAALVEGRELTDAIGYANCAAAISVTRMGVLEATPNRAETEAAYLAWRQSHG